MKMTMRMVELGLTESDLAKKYPPNGCSRQFIHQIRTGERGQTMKVAEKIAFLLEYDNPLDLLRG